MSLTNIFRLLPAVGVMSGACYGASYVAIDFEQLAAPSGCVRNFSSPPAATNPSLRALKVPGATISGGQVISHVNPFQTSNNVYFTLNSCAGTQPAITIVFDGPVSQPYIEVGTTWTSSLPLQVVDDAGENFTFQLSSSNIAGQSLFLQGNNVRKVTLTIPGSMWTANSPAGFYIDNLSLHFNNRVDFFDPVPNLISGTGLVSDPQSLATLGTMVKGVVADGTARVVLSAPAAHVGEVIVFNVLDEQGNPSRSTQEDGAIGAVGDQQSSRHQSIRVAAQDSTAGPAAFAIYYPPADFSRGNQDNQRASRIVTIEVDSTAPNTPSYRRPLEIWRPPVLLVHDLWGEPADWDFFTPFVNDSTFFVRRAAYNGVLNGRISASIPTYSGNNIGGARESALGMSYNAPSILAQVEQTVNDFRAVQNVAASQADVVAHGMGGTLVRAALQLANYRAPESFGQGSVNKLITIGAPHLGTPLATALLQNNNACFRGVLASAGMFSFASATIDGNNVGGGVGDLQGNGNGGGLSSALAQIQQTGGPTAPTALLAAMTSHANTTGLDSHTGMAQFMRSACTGNPLAASFTSSGWSDVFGDANDGMVSRTSQQAGFFGLALPGIVHSEALETLGFNAPGELDAQSFMPNAATELLNAPINSFVFRPLP